MNEAPSKTFIQSQNEDRSDYKPKKKQISQLVIIWRSRTTKGLLFVLTFTIASFLLLQFLLLDEGSYIGDDGHTCAIDRTYRIRCGEPNATWSYCNEINCCYDNSTKLCYHYLPSKYYYYNESENVYKTSLPKTPFKWNMKTNIKLSVKEKDENIVHIILHESETVEPTNISSKNYKWILFKNPLSVEVYRKETDDILLTTVNGPTIISENYWEWSFQLTDEYLFGLGQILIDLDQNTTLTKVIYENDADHNTLPIFIAYRNKKYHGVKVLHKGPLEVSVLPSNVISLKSLTGNSITLELSVGPTPEDVLKQQKKPEVSDSVKLWTLGVHICREGSSLTFKDIVKEYKDDDFNGVSYESDCLHENVIMSLWNQNQKYNDPDELIETIKAIKNKGKRFMLSLTPQVPVDSILYNNTKNTEVFYQSNNTDYKGKYLDKDVVYPYFGHKKIDQFIDELDKDINSFLTDISFDVLLSHNWAPDKSFEMKASGKFQYLSKELIEALSFTLPWDTQNTEKLQMEDHNDYGTLQMNALLRNFTNFEEMYVMSASHNFDMSGPIIVQNVDISWTNFKKAIMQNLYNSIFGYPLISIPVCGSTDKYDKDVHESLCMRWYLMASTAPLFRISSDLPRRDPNHLNTLTATNTAKNAINLRYQLRYYFYTILNNHEPLMRPMFYDFSDDTETFKLEEQYMVGKSLLIAHPTLPDQTELSVYLPPSAGVWYDFWGGTAYESKSTNSFFTFNIFETDWIAFIRQGSIIPLITEGSENTISVKLIVALENNKEVFTASGTLFLGENLLLFTSTDKEIKIQKMSQTFVEKIDAVFELNDIVLYSREGPKHIKINPAKDLTEITTDLQISYN